jgi:hypothetical protein
MRLVKTTVLQTLLALTLMQMHCRQGQVCAVQRSSVDYQLR